MGLTSCGASPLFFFFLRSCIIIQKRTPLPIRPEVGSRPNYRSGLKRSHLRFFWGGWVPLVVSDEAECMWLAPLAEPNSIKDLLVFSKILGELEVTQTTDSNQFRWPWHWSSNNTNSHGTFWWQRDYSNRRREGGMVSVKRERFVVCIWACIERE